MATKSTAAKTKLNPAPTEITNEKWFEGVKSPNDVHPVCGHVATAHEIGESGKVNCPALPPAKQITVDAAVVAKGGKPGFVKQLEDATGITAANELSAKAAENFATPAPADEQSRELLGVKAIQPMARNPRGSLGDLTDLKKSLEASGLIVPILVRVLEEEKRYEIVSGHRRFAAAVALGWDSLLCDVRIMTELQALEINLSEQLQRRDLTPLEEAEACRSLIELSGYDTKQVAGKLGQSTSWVTKRLSLCGLAPEVKKQLGKGEITLTLATALAALPTQKMQAEAAEKLAEELEYDPMTTEEQLEKLREDFCRPLKGVSWKLVDADLVPEAGPCSTCPKNSANNQTPGLFDNVKAPPTCSNVICFDSKVKAAWDKATAKFKAAGAKILPAGEGAKIFNMYDGTPHMAYASRYVFAKDIVQEDGSKRSWAQIVEKMKPDERPQLHVAQDSKGGIHELFVKDKATEAIAEHLELKWAKKAVARDEEQVGAREDQKEEVELQKIRSVIIDQVKSAVADRIEKKGLTLLDARSMMEEYDYNLEQYLKAQGIDDRAKQKLWPEKASLNMLLAFFWWKAARFSSYDGFDDEFKALAKASGFDLTAMVKAQLATAKAESTKAAKK